MSSRAPAWFETKYVDGVTHVLQDEGYRLQGTAMMPAEIKGNIVNFKVAGSGSATVKSTAIENRPVMNADRQLVPVTMVDYEANEWINVTDLEKMSENEQQIAQQTAAYAMGRRFDQIIMGAMNASGAAITTLGTGAAVISIVDAIEAQARILSTGYTSMPKISMAIPTMWMAQLLLFREFANADYVDDRPLMKRIGARSFLGIDFIPLPDEQFAIPAAGQFDTYMWLQSGVGFASNYKLNSRIDYVAEKTAWFAANNMGAAAVTILPNAVRRMRFLTPTALTRPTP